MKWLDVGCGKPSRFLVPFTRPYALHLDVDREAWHLEVLASCEKLPFKPKSIDVVRCAHLLEHLRTPIRVLEDFRRIARYFVVIKVPNAAYTTQTGEGPNHLYSWNQHTLNRLLSEVFEKVKIQETVRIPPKFNAGTRATIRLALLSKFIRPQELTAVCTI